MRLSFFVIFSLALHATALSYPIFLSAPRGQVLLPVTIFAPTGGSGGAPAGNGGVKAIKERQAALKRGDRVPYPNGTDAVAKADRQEEHKVAPGIIATSVASEGFAVASNPTHGGAAADVGLAGLTVLTGDAGNGVDGSGGLKGATEGHGDGNGSGSGGGRVSWLGVSYDYNPRPEYPYIARRDGREGTVVLRVLVDEEGRSKSLEVNRSSGFEALDKAAMETVRRWRFHPARYGDRRVEAWVNIPIVFRLADLKD
jgi:TonB family protein